jgi:hypothetical protein
VPAFAQGSRPLPLLDPLENRLRSVKSLSNFDRGFGGTNEFYQLSKVFMTRRKAEDFQRMLDDKNPIVRAMGLLCLAQLDVEKYRATLLSHTTDEEYVYLNQGCLVSTITVGEFVTKLLKNPYFLNDPNFLMEKRPAI